jgi:hypothetical protein
MPTQNREKANKTFKRWYAKPENKKKQYEWVARRKAENQAWYMEYKSTLSCLRCGEDDSYTLDFHHIKPEDKKYLISTIYGKSGRKNRKRVS